MGNGQREAEHTSRVLMGRSMKSGSQFHVCHNISQERRWDWRRKAHQHILLQHITERSSSFFLEQRKEYTK